MVVGAFLFHQLVWIVGAVATSLLRGVDRLTDGTLPLDHLVLTVGDAGTSLLPEGRANAVTVGIQLSTSSSDAVKSLLGRVDAATCDCWGFTFPPAKTDGRRLCYVLTCDCWVVLTRSATLVGQY